VTAASLAASAVQCFGECYGSPAEGSWFAPGRVNLIGEHTDYNQGFVLPFAIGPGVAVAAARRGDGLIAAASRQAGCEIVTAAVGALAPGAVDGWAAYPAGICWVLRKAGYRVGGVSIAVDSDLPAGAGLSSSAALECAVALALTELHGLGVPRPELATLASRAENQFVGAPTGIMDQSAVLLCAAGEALLLDCRSGAGTPVPFDPASAGLAVLIIDTRTRHALVDGRYQERREECGRAAASLGVRSLREVDDVVGALARLADPRLMRRARHVLTENSRVTAAAELLRAGLPAGFGPLLTASHLSLRDDFEVSWPQADLAVDAAVGAGAAGARMMGGGFGGSVIALIPGGGEAAIRAEVTAGFAARGWPEPGFALVTPSGSARRLR
jgi:galactokinase